MLPAGWLARAEAQLAALTILKRDQAELMEAPAPSGREEWQQYSDGSVRVAAKAAAETTLETRTQVRP